MKDTNSSLVICANIGPNMATFKLYNTKEEDSLKLHYTISNLGDLGDQLYQLWVQINYILKEHYPYKAYTLCHKNVYIILNCNFLIIINPHLCK